MIQDLTAFIKTHKFVLIFLTSLVLITYFNSLNNAFVSDDIADIAKNPKLGSFSYVTSHSFGFIRPLLYFLAFKIGGSTPAFFRSINLFFHLGSVILLYVIVRRLHNSSVAILSSAIFAVHPGFGEAIVWISGGSYPQATFFLLLSFLFYLLQKKGVIYYLSSLIFFYFSFISQMVVVVFPAALVIYELSFSNLKQNFKKIVPFAFLSVVLFLFPLFQVSERVHTLETVHYQQIGIENPLLIIPIAISSYLQLIFWPKDLTLYHSELSLSNLGFVFSWLLVVSFLIILIFSFLKDKKIFFWSSLFILALLPTLVTASFHLTWIVAERYLYLPSVGAVTATVAALFKTTHSKKAQIILISILSLIILGLSIRTIVRNIDWQSEDNLWIATGKTSPSSPNTWNNLGDVYGRRGDKQKAAQAFIKAIELKPNYADAYHNLGNTYAEMGEKEKALESYKHAASQSPILWQSYQNMAAIYFDNGETSLALQSMQKAISINSNEPILMINMGIIYLKVGDRVAAARYFNQALQLDPSNERARVGLQQLSP